MVWFKVDDGMAFHAKVVEAGNAAIGLWTRAGSWCADHLTDGFVPDHMIRSLGTPGQARTLVRVKLWLRADGGYQFWQWNDPGRQPTRDQVEVERGAARNRMNAARKARSSGNVRPNNERTSEEVRVTPTRPDHTEQPPQKPSVSSSGAPRRAEPNAAPVVGAWVEAVESATGERPAARLVAQIGRQARELLTEGKPVDRLVAAAREAGRKGFADLGRELLRSPLPAQHTSGDPSTAWMRGDV